MPVAPETPSPLVSPSQSTDNLGRSAGVVGLATLTSRVLGLARDTVLAAVFGAGNEMDAFVVGFRLPNLVRELFAEGAMSAGLVPAFTRHLTLKGKASAWKLGNNVITALVIVTGVLVCVGMFAAPVLVRAYAGDYAATPGKIDLAITLARVMLPFLMLAAIAAAAMGMLNSLGHYFMPALAPAAFNVATIAGAVLLTPFMPMVGQARITAIAVAALVGGAGQIAVQWPSLRQEGFRLKPAVDWRDPALREVVLLMGPGTLGLAATQINLLVITQFAVSQGTGAVSWLQYGFRLIDLPGGLFGASIATVVLPAIARHAAIDDRRAIGETLAKAIGLMLMVNVPASVGLFLLAQPIVQLLLERGHFLRGDTVATAAAVQCYAIGLVGYAINRIALPVFYALRSSRVAVFLSMLTIALNLALSVVFVRWLGFRGLALATSASAILNGVLALFLLRFRLGSIGGTALRVTLVKIVVASAAMAGIVIVAQGQIFVWMPGDALVVQMVRLLLTIGLGLVTVAVVARILRISEFDAVVDQVRSQLAAHLR